MEWMKTVLHHLTLCDEGKVALMEAAETVKKNHQEVLQTMSAMWKESCRIEDTLPLRERVAEETGLSIYTVNAVLILEASRWLKEIYQEKNWSDEIFYDSMDDLAVKAVECKQVRGVWGTFVETWYNAFFAPRLWQLGRLSFARSVYWSEKMVTLCGVTVKQNDRVYGIHIPSGRPLTEEMRMDSYRRAYAFFKEELGGKPMICVCDSWLLFEKNREIFPPHLNMIKFMDDFRIVESHEQEDFSSNAWRIFGCDLPEDLMDLPTDNTPRRALAAWLQSGKKAGEGYGIFAFDGEKIYHE